MELLCRLGLGLGLFFRVRVSINLRNIEPSEYRPITHIDDADMQIVYHIQAVVKLSNESKGTLNPPFPFHLPLPFHPLP